MKPRILFISSICPAQFSLLCQHLHEQGMAETYFLTSLDHFKAQRKKYDNLVPFQTDGDAFGSQSYYYSMQAEKSARHALGVHRAIEALTRKNHIDLIVSHALWGSPYFLYDEFDIPVVTYSEAPSYRLHGWDAQYPADLAQRLTDHNLEMVHMYQALRSNLTIVPSEYCRQMYPEELRHRIAVQFEGFDIQPLPPAREGERPFTVGFAARDLSSAKGFEQFVRLAAKMSALPNPPRFVAIGSPDDVTYGYEPQYVKRFYGREDKTFKDYLMERFNEPPIEFLGKLPYEQYAQALADIDLFVYPLRHGVANWGLMEILMRGKAIVGTRRCFLPEVIEHGVSGLLVDEPDEDWIAAIERVRDDPALRQRLEQGAAKRGQEYHIRAVAPRYMALFERAMKTPRDRRGGGV